MLSEFELGLLVGIIITGLLTFLVYFVLQQDKINMKHREESYVKILAKELEQRGIKKK